jgi:hypothetical protein
VHVADNGIDAEWERVLTAGEAPTALEPLLQLGLNVFQHKKRGAGPGNRADIVSALVTEPRRAVLAVEIRTGKTLASYVLWTTVDLSVDQHETLRTAILDEYSDDATVPIHAHVVGPAELGAMINDLPHLRSAFFATDAFQDWCLSSRRISASPSRSIRRGDPRRSLAETAQSTSSAPRSIVRRCGRSS